MTTIIKIAAGAVAAFGFAAMPHAVAHADTVNLSQLEDIDSLPVCQLEDGSDAASLPCLWTNDGNAWLTYADHSVLVVDNTVRSHTYASTDDDA
jgi:hypothetical protein